MEELIAKTEAFVKKTHMGDSTGHDWHHIDRVRKAALAICEKEGAGNSFIIEMAALLHDIPDEKLNESEKEGYQKLHFFLDSLELRLEVKSRIMTIIQTVSFKGGRKIELDTIEAKIVQDADRLDAIGAIGIARAFAYGGKKGQPLYDPELPIREKLTPQEYRSEKSSTIHHFYDKLIKLQGLLNTETAKQIAEKRQQFMNRFLTEFYAEWKGQYEDVND